MSDDLKENQLEHLHNIIIERFLDACNIIVKEELDNNNFKFCVDTIQNTLLYIARKRNEE